MTIANMNPLQSFGNNVVQGAKLVTPSRVLRGAKKLGGDLLGDVKNSLTPKKAMAAKMPATPPAVTTPDYNQGFKAYNNRLKDALNY